MTSGKWGELDGTSMAAPHVSGAGAMLMARYDELIGEPQRIRVEDEPHVIDLLDKV